MPRTREQAKQKLREAGLKILKENVEVYSLECLKIRAKDGSIVPFKWNRAQRFLHQKIEAHKARTGRVRVLVGKGRQTGGSTYVGARFFHKTTLTPGVQTYILTHEQEATDNLFDMVLRFHKHCPLRPSTQHANAKELYFDRLDSGYTVGTAGTKSAGRSRTIQLLHWSEVAWSPNAAGHQAGIVQTVPDLPDTEIIKESTGNGPWGDFYEAWQQAEGGYGDYETIFMPWYWSDEYMREVPQGWAPDTEERQYQRLYNLTDGQMVWRRAKIAELRDPKLFKREYPANTREMFEAAGETSYIDPELVITARKNTLEGIGPLVVGVDPARFGDDRFSVAWRRGRKVLAVESRTKIGTTEALAWLKDIIDQHRPIKMFIDAGGGGDRMYDVLVAWGEPYASTVTLVNFGSAPLTETLVLEDGTKRAGPANRRAEMWMRSKEWLEQTGGADLPDLDSLQADACAPGYTYRTTDQRLVLESKEQLRARGVRSSDEWDAVVLTFAEPVAERRPRPPPRVLQQQISANVSQGWMAA